MVKVLILHQYYNTPAQGGALRSYYLATSLVASGITPIVITAHKEKKYKVEISEGVEVHYLPVPYQNSFGFRKRSWAFIKFMIGAIRLARNFKDADICYAMSVPLTVGGASLFIRRFYGIRYVFEVGDLWPDAPVEMGFVRNPALTKLLYTLERRIYDRATAIVGLSQPILDIISTRTTVRRLFLLPNMSDTGFYKPGIKNADIETRFNVRDKFVVSYIGAAGYANGLEFYLECAKAAGQHGLNIHFILAGEGALLPGLKKLATSLDLKNLTFVPFQNRQGVADIMSITDAVFVGYRRSPILETGSPNKYFDGLAAGKLIIVNFSGWIRKEIEQKECGIYLDPQKPELFAAALQPFITDRGRLKLFQGNARALAERKYARDQLGREFVRILRDLASEK